MAITCPRCKHQYDITLFEFGSVVECDCGAKIKLDPGKGVVLEEENLSNKRRLIMSTAFISGSEVASRIRNLIHKSTQVKKDKVHLTLKQIYFLDEKGSLDFSGKELTVAKRKPMVAEKKSPEDEYGWWCLGEGTYLMEFNEQIDLNEKEVAILQPREELLQNFCFHPLRIITSPQRLSPIPLIVGSKGMNVKQNARISVLKVVKI